VLLLSSNMEKEDLNIEKLKHSLALALSENEILKKYKIEANLLREEYTGLETHYLETLRDMKKNLEFLRHEIKGGPLNGAIGIIQNMLTYPELFSEEQKTEYLSYALEGIKKAGVLIDFANPDLVKLRESINLENISNGIAISNVPYLKENKIGLNVRYGKKNNSPIEIYGNNAIFTGILNTLIGNSLLWTPKYSRIEIGIREDKGNNLEILLENKTNPEKRKGPGEGKGIGQNTVKGFIKNMRGEFHNYGKSEIITNANKNKYDQTNNYGDTKATDNIKGNEDIYGVKIIIPMKEISKP